MGGVRVPGRVRSRVRHVIVCDGLVYMVMFVLLVYTFVYTFVYMFVLFGLRHEAILVSWVTPEGRAGTDTLAGAPSAAAGRADTQWHACIRLCSRVRARVRRKERRVARKSAAKVARGEGAAGSASSLMQ